MRTDLSLMRAVEESVSVSLSYDVYETENSLIALRNGLWDDQLVWGNHQWFQFRMIEGTSDVRRLGVTAVNLNERYTTSSTSSV